MRRNRVCLFSVLIGAVAMSGCAGYHISPIPKAQADGTTWGTQCGNDKDGYLFYEPELYFKATIVPGQTNKDDPSKSTPPSVTLTPFYLPNPKKPYRVKTYNVLAKADFTFQFTDGWQLTSIADKSDNSTIANTMAEQLSAMFKSVGTVALDGGKPETVLVAFYRPVYNDDGVIDHLAEVMAMDITTNTADQASKPKPKK